MNGISERGSTVQMKAHQWEWVNHYGEIHATDIWKCNQCGKEVKKRNNQDPAPGKCKIATLYSSSVRRDNS